MTTDSLVVDIGGDVGALIVYAPPQLVGQEIEITAVGTWSVHRLHNVVHPRRAGTRVVHAAVFPDLPAGTYHRRGNGVADVRAFAVTGGRVTEVDWM